MSLTLADPLNGIGHCPVFASGRFGFDIGAWAAGPNFVPEPALEVGFGVFQPDEMLARSAGFSGRTFTRGAGVSVESREPGRQMPDDFFRNLNTE